MTSLASGTGRFFVTSIMSLITLGVFCNQTIATMMVNDIMKKTYIDAGSSESELAIDMENSVIILAGIVPWTIACTVPLEFMQTGYGALPYSLLLYMIPLCYGIQKKLFGFKIS